MKTIKNATVNPPFKWTGGKNRMRDQYRDLFFPDGEVKTFVDMFCGACSVSLWVAENYPDAKIVLNDNNSELIELYRVFQEDFDAMYARYSENVKTFLSFQSEKKLTYTDIANFLGEEVTDIEAKQLMERTTELSKFVLSESKLRKKGRQAFDLDEERLEKLKASQSELKVNKTRIKNHTLPWEYLDTFPKEGNLVRTLDKKNFYYSLRDRYAHHHEEFTRAENAGDLFFMMRVNFNGIWKGYDICNGRYSTPPGTLLVKEKFFDPAQVLKFKAFLDRCEIHSGDFGDLTQYQEEGTYYYADPPYRDSIVVYDGAFEESDQKRLVNFLRECSDNGCWISESNKEIGDGFWEQHFGPDYPVHDMTAKYTAGRGKSTLDVKEVLITNFLSRTTETDGEGQG
jgi:site-specific DNA-adenine methylase